MTAVKISEFAAVMKRLLAPPGNSQASLPFDRIAVAVSGCPESMALCFLLKEVLGKDKLISYTVNTKLRHGSDRFCDMVAESVEKMGLQHQTLTVDWTQPGTHLVSDTLDGPLPPEVRDTMSWYRVEVAERQRRYNMLAQASKNSGANILALGHSFERQASLCLHRSLKSSGIEGMAGFNAKDSEVYLSFVPAAQHVSERLKATCREAGLSWKESNENPIMMQHNWKARNELRQVAATRALPSVNARTPTPLSASLSSSASSSSSSSTVTSSIQQLIQQNQDTTAEHFENDFAKFMVQRANERQELHAQGISADDGGFFSVSEILDSCTLRDPPTGTAFVNINANAQTIHDHWLSNPLHGNRVLIDLIKWASPMHITISMAQVDHTRQKLIEAHREGRFAPLSVGQVLLQPPRPFQTGAHNWILSRNPFDLKTKRKLHVPMKIGETTLWDGRFYITLKAPKEMINEKTLDEASAMGDEGRPSDSTSSEPTFCGVPLHQLRFMVRPFVLADYHRLLQRFAYPGDPVRNEKKRHILNHYMKKMPPYARETIPCVALVQDNGNHDYVVCVPSLNVVMEKNLVDVKLSLRSHPRVVRRNEEIGFFLPEDTLEV
ncbi:hypothetical protein HDU76_001898 [Blyttiomyces sp. JEL0837]|nr:hypothetical protein HDU76_001898 [Blyttiomyces sp. JEL0837]